MQQQALPLDNVMPTLPDDQGYLRAAYYAIPRRLRCGSLDDYLSHGPSAQALRMYANAIRERMQAHG